MRVAIALLACGCATGQLAPDASLHGPTPDAQAIFADAFVSTGADAGFTDAGVPDALGADGPCVDTGAVCATGNPGACASGHEHCVGGAPSCVPDQTTQTCYDGPAGSAGTGACTAGTQSCIGALGACTGEVVPSAENCFNDLDDDCDGVVNDGCPDHVVLGSSYTLTAEGGATGTAVSAMCPSGEFVARAQVYFDYGDGEAAGIGVFCVSPTLTRGASSYTLGESAMPASATAVFYGTSTTMPANYDDNCATGQTFGTAWETYTRSTTSAVYGLGVWCASGTTTLDSFNDLSIDIAFDNVGGGGNYTTGTDAYQDCDADSVVIGYTGHDGKGLNEIQPVCAPVQVVYQ